MKLESRGNRRSGLAVIAAFAATLLAAPVSASIPLPDVPLQSGSALTPNILYVIDDSGSMAWDFMPGPFNSNGVPNMSPVNDKLIAYTRNQIYYNPYVEYRPWRNADGTFMSNRPYTSAYDSDTQASNTVDLHNRDRHFLVPKAGMTDPSDTRQYWRYTLKEDNYEIERRELTWQGGSWGWRNAVNITSLTWGATTRTVAEEYANYANWYSYHRTRAKVAKAGASYAFNDLSENVRVGFDTIWERNTYDIPVNQDQGLFRDNGGGFSYTNRSTWFSRMLNAGASNGTPLRRALTRAGDYFEQTSSSGPWGPAAAAGQLSCRQNFTILTTDGYWNTDSGPSGGDGVAGPLHTSTSGATYQYPPSRPYQDNATGTLADVAMNYWKNDLRPDLVNNVPSSTANPAFWQHMVTFGISIGLQGTLDPNTAVLQPGANNDLTDGGLSWPNPLDAEDDHRIDDLFHAAVNSRGTFVAASNPEQFTQGLRAALATIVERTGSSSNVSANSASVQSDTRLFQASFVSGRWTGELVAYPVDATGVQTASPIWRGSQGIPAAASRKVFTWGGASGAAFPTTAQNTALGAQKAAYIRGVRTNEQQNGGTLRDRPHLLGDIVNSSPFYVKDTGTVYVGSNAGMLHAFKAEGAGQGTELFAYVPGNLNLNKLKQVPDLDYTHYHFVDGPITVSDRNETPGKNYLVGALGRGGKGVFGLDVTNPATFGTANVKWDHDASDHGKMGNVLGRPVISRLDNGDVGAIVANGPNSTGNTAVLYVLDVTDGDVIAEIDTGVGSAANPNGLMSPTAWDYDADGDVDYVYAGDLLGNLWRFDLTGNANSWDNASNRMVLFTARDAGNKRQPITGAPTVGLNPADYSLWVFFGTGRYLNQLDIINADGSRNTDVQTWYGLKEEGAAIAGRAALQQRSILAAGSIDGKPVRVFQPASALSPTAKGWYVDLLTPPSGTREGERMISDPLLISSTLIGSSIIPNTDPCEFGGRGYVYQLNAFTGASSAQPLFDIDRDGQYADDTLTVNGQPIPVGGIDLGIAMPSNPTVVGTRLVVGGSTGLIGDINIDLSQIQGRISWREIVGE